jgi:hypothetical protein
MTTVAGAVPAVGIVLIASPIIVTPLGSVEITIAVRLSFEGIIVNTPRCPGEKDKYTIPGTSTRIIPG